MPKQRTRTHAQGEAPAGPAGGDRAHRRRAGLRRHHDGPDHQGDRAARELGLLALRQQGRAAGRRGRARLRGLALRAAPWADDGRVARQRPTGCEPSWRPIVLSDETGSTTGGWGCCSPSRPARPWAPPRATASSPSGATPSSGLRWWSAALGWTRRRRPTRPSDGSPRTPSPGSRWRRSTASTWPGSPIPAEDLAGTLALLATGLEAVASQLAQGSCAETPPAARRRPAPPAPETRDGRLTAAPRRRRGRGRERLRGRQHLAHRAAAGLPGELALLALQRQGRPARRRRRVLLPGVVRRQPAWRSRPRHVVDRRSCAATSGRAWAACRTGRSSCGSATCSCSCVATTRPAARARFVAVRQHARRATGTGSPLPAPRSRTSPVPTSLALMALSDGLFFSNQLDTPAGTSPSSATSRRGVFEAAAVPAHHVLTPDSRRHPWRPALHSERCRFLISL